ncbi:ribosome-binding protein 1-like isoform X9 [Branchiostoma floridae x Branchiostoma belcheri]
MDVSDPQTLAIAVFGGFVLVSAICIFLVSTFGMKETTYEEAMERQRRAIEREMQQSRAEKQKAREKKPARFNKKEKPKKEPSGLPEPQRETSSSPRVQEVKPFAEQKAQPETPPPQPQPKAKGKAKDKNKENQAPNKEQTAPAAPKAAVKTVEPRVAKAQPQPVPVQAAVRVAPAPKSAPEPARQTLAKETIKAEAEPVAQQVVAPAPSKKKKTKIEAAVTVADAPAMTAVMDSLVTQTAKLSDAEMQQLIEIMLSKQGRKSTEWAKAGQKADSMKKQAEDFEKKFQDGQQQVLASHQKMKELRQELQQERLRFSAQETSLQQKVSQQQQEIQALYTRMKTTHEQHLAENQKLHNQLAEMQTNSSQEAHIVQLQEENKILKSAVNEATKGTEMRIQNDLANLRTEHARLKNEYNSVQARLQGEEDGRRKAETALSEAQQQVRQVHASQRDAESSLTKRLNEVTEQLRKSEAKNNAMGTDIKKAKDLNEKNKALSDELETAKSAAGGDAGAQDSGLQQQLKDLQAQLAESRKTVEDKEKLIKELEKKSKAAEVPSANGDIEHKAEGSSMQTISVVEHELLISEKEKTVTQLQEEVTETKAEIAKLQTTVEQQKKKNNDLREKNWKAMDALNAAEKSLAEKEKVTSAKDDTATSDKDRSQAREALRRIFPDISMSIDPSLEYQVWLTSFEKAALARLEEMKTASVQPAEVPSQTPEDEGVEAKLAEAAEREKELQEECEKYKTVLADTESILNRLQSSVESEEQKWQEKLRLANEDLEQARGEVRAMQEAVQQVKSESQQGSEELQALQEERDKLRQELQTLQAAGSSQAENGPAGPTEEDLNKRDEEIAALKARLEKEKKLCKELGSAATKLQSLLKTAEDQLKKERENVKKLQGSSGEKGSTAQSEVVEAPQSLNQSQIEKDLADALQEVQGAPDDGTSV